ncbi:MAG: hypothetical protein NZ741_12545, partial [Armatimonadetes bacterium]|nr:hypothetical protein [Armatimonadota bacterium]
MQVPLPLMEEISRCPAEEQATLAALLSTLHFSKVYRFPFPTAEYVAQLVENSRSQLLIAPPQERLRVIVSELTSRLRLPPHTEPDELSKWLLWKAADRFR